MAETRIALRYALTNILLAAMIVASFVGNPWIWVVFFLTLAVGGLFDETLGDDASHLGEGWRAFYDFNLFLTLPLVLALAIALFLRARSIVLFDPTDLSLPAIAGKFKDLMIADLGAYPAAVIATGYFFAVAGSTAAHELGHRISRRPAILCARMLHAFSFNSSFEVYHGRFHHRNVGYFDDPSTARRQESVYAFLYRSVVWQLRLAWGYERARLQRSGSSAWSWNNRVIACICVELALVAAAAGIGGLVGVGGFAIAAMIARALHEAINYVQHYGLVRVEGTPIAARHSWDTHRIISNALLYNLPRHADHHRTGAKPFWALDAMAEAPQLPFGYQTMTLIAFLPSLWRKVMDPMLDQWDARFASDGERALVRAGQATDARGVEGGFVAAGLVGDRPPQ